MSNALQRHRYHHYRSTHDNNDSLMPKLFDRLTLSHLGARLPSTRQMRGVSTNNTWVRSGPEIIIARGHG